jgi:serine/threonine protein phosphatase PrpC
VKQPVIAGPPLRASGATDVGRRRLANEDRFHVDVSRGIFIVVDGMGGQAAGDKAAETAIAAIRERLERQTGTLPDRLREALTIANNAVHRMAASRPQWRGMACVATAVVVTGQRAVVGHVGDSRLYRLLDGGLEKVTPDHSPVGEREDAREMSELEAMRHPRRNEVYRDIGSEPREVSDREFVFVAEIDLPPGGALLLCSDGLTDLVASETIRRIAATHAGSPDTLVRALIAAANDSGGKDNITAIYVERERSPLSAPAVSTPGVPRPGVPRPGVLRPGATTAILVALTAAASLVAGVYLGVLAAERGWRVPGLTSAAPPPVPGTVVVGPGQSIMAAVSGAAPGTTVLVEPGEYRERLTLRDHIRVVSRVPRGATIRLPDGAADSDAAVVAVGITHAELSGFRIVGDAASPLGLGVIARDAAVRLSDLEISGASTAAMDLGGSGDVHVSGSFLHDNAGAAMVIRTGASPRIAHSVFARNAVADVLAVPLIVEVGAAPAWSHNVFKGMTQHSVTGLDAAARAVLTAENWFIPPPAAVPAVREGGRSR